MPENRFRNIKTHNDLNKAANTDNGTYPTIGDPLSGGAPGARVTRWRRLSFRPIFVFMRAMLFWALIFAIANAAFGFFMAEDAVTPVTPTSDIQFDILGVGLLFTFDFNFTVDGAQVIERALDGAALGLVVGLLVAIFSCIIRAIAEGVRRNRFSSVRTRLDFTREIIWESFVRVKDKPSKVFYSDWQKRKKGNLFLTYTSLEFYDNEYETSHRNFLVKLRDISVVESKGIRKLIVYTAKGRYVIRVPLGRAKFWKKALLHAIQLRQRVNYGR